MMPAARKGQSSKPDKYNSFMTFDEYGRPFIIMKEQADRDQINGLEVIKSHIMAAKAVTSIMKSSLGPKSLDKVMVSADGELIVTNDGATILKNMDLDHAIAKLFVELSECQDTGVGDGTTGVVVLAGALLEETEKLIEKGIHPIRIADGFELAANFCIKHLESISEEIQLEKDKKFLEDIATTSLNSKIVSKCNSKFAAMAVEALLKVYDKNKDYIDLEHIKLDGKPGGSLEDTILINGVVIDQPLSHGHMEKEMNKVAVAVLSCGMEVPKPVQIKAYLEMKSAEAYLGVKEYEKKLFDTMVSKDGMLSTLKWLIPMVDREFHIYESLLTPADQLWHGTGQQLQRYYIKLDELGVNFIVCKGSIDEAANYALLQSETGGVRYASEKEIELLRCATGARVVGRFEDLAADKLGFVGTVREINLGMENRITVFEDCLYSSVVTIIIRGGNNMIIEEAKRSFHDALCMIRNLILDNKIIYGGGSAELSCAIAVSKEADQISSLEQYAFRAFADALESIPLALAENCGYSPIHLLTEIKARQIQEDNPHLGVDCMMLGTCDMKKQQVIETLHSKRQQILLAMQVVKQILKIDEVRTTDRNYGKHTNNNLY